MIQCDLCLRFQQNPLFGDYEKCGHFFCQLCRHKRKNLLDANICLVCLVDDKKYTQQEIDKFKFKNLPWKAMRYEDISNH